MKGLASAGGSGIRGDPSIVTSMMRIISASTPVIPKASRIAMFMRTRGSCTSIAVIATFNPSQECLKPISLYLSLDLLIWLSALRENTGQAPRLRDLLRRNA
jgi:hypothetical protein